MIDEIMNVNKVSYGLNIDNMHNMGKFPEGNKSWYDLVNRSNVEIYDTTHTCI